MGFGKDGKGVILTLTSNNNALGTLGSQTALKLDNGLIDNLEDDFRLISTEFQIHVTGGNSEDSVILGIADNELTVAEIAEALDAQPVDRNDNLTNERAMRPVFPIGIISDLSGVADGHFQAMQKKTVRWTFGDSEGWTWFVYNAESAALGTGAIVTLFAKHYGVWVT